METSKHILIAGQSIYLAAVASVLRKVSGLEIQFSAWAIEVDTPPPDTILVVTSGDLMPALKYLESYPNARVIALDELTHTLTVLCGTAIPAHTTQDLIDVIMKQD